MIKNEFIKIVRNPLFIVLLTFVTMFFLLGFSMVLSNNYGYEYSDVDTIYRSGVLNNLNGVGRIFIIGFNILIPIITMFSFSTSIQGEKNGYDRYVQLRSSRKSYLLSKMIASFVASFVILCICTLLNLIVVAIVFKDNPYENLYLIMNFLNSTPSNLQIIIIENYLLFSGLYYILTSFFISLLSCFSVFLLYHLSFIKAFLIYIGIQIGVQIILSLNEGSILNILFFDFNIFSFSHISGIVIKYLIIIGIYFMVCGAIILNKKKNYEI